MDANNVANALAMQEICRNMKESAHGKRLMDANSVAIILLTREVCINIKEFTQGKSLMNAISVASVLHKQDIGIKHAIVHSGEKTYECKQCSKCVSQVGDLRRHEGVHTGKFKPY